MRLKIIRTALQASTCSFKSMGTSTHGSSKKTFAAFVRNTLKPTSVMWENTSKQILVCVCSVVSDSCNSMDCNPPGSSVHGISQARILAWAAISFSRGSFPTQGSNSRLLYLCFGRWMDSLPWCDPESLSSPLRTHSSPLRMDLILTSGRPCLEK